MIVVFGGSFNPPTIAHKAIYDHINRHIDVDLFIYLPVSRKYAKEDLIENRHRLNMLKLMSDDLPKAVVSDMECKDEVYRGTYASLKRFQREFPDQTIGFVVGADHLVRLSTWIEAEKMLREFVFIVVNRNRKKLDDVIDNDDFLSSHRNHLKILPEFDMDIASSDYRENLDAGMVTPDVHQYIQNHALYRGAL